MATFVFEQQPHPHDEDIDGGIMVITAPSKAHLMRDITSKLLISLDEYEHPNMWYTGYVRICDERIGNWNFMNIDDVSLGRLTKEYVKEQIERKAIIGFGMILPLKEWARRNQKPYH